jgi:hypothetical protein
MKESGLSLGALALAALSHVPCCGVNLALVLGSTGTGLTLFEGLSAYRPWLLGFSAAMAVLTLWLAFRPRKACCHDEGCAAHGKRASLGKVLAVAAACAAVAGFFVQPSGGHDHSDHAEGETVAVVSSRL